MCIHVRSLGEKIGWHLCRLYETAGENCFASPAGFIFAEVAAFPLVFVTLWRMLITNAQLQPGEGLLMIDIRGGIAQRIPPSRQKNRCAGDSHIGYP
jgi:hypothetical protein